MGRKFKGMTKRSEDYPQWYQEVIKGAELAQHAPVKGCMVIRPYGYAIWENIQRQLDEMIKETGHENAYFPLFVPESFINKEKDHVEGFAPECAVVTHAGGHKLEENLYIRPTSETIIGDVYRGWIQSYRDLPLLINQWANVVRWEKRTRLFLRTSEFLWQEGHTAHETPEEAQEETLKMLEVYRSFAEDYLAMPVITGEKPAYDRFAGADHTYSIEGMMQDRKALQAGTSHNLGQNFAKAFEIKYLSREQKEEFAWTTSWGVSTRLIGGVIMTHGDDKGVVMPPKVAPLHVVIVPIARNDEDKAKVNEYLEPLVAKLKKMRYGELKLRVKVDNREALRPGPKFFEWERKGVPLRVEVGMRDVAAGNLVFARRDGGEKQTMSRDSFAENVLSLLDEIQQSIYDKALAFRKENTVELDDLNEFKAFFTPKNKKEPEIHGGFVLAHYAGCDETEKTLKELKVTVRCVPLGQDEEDGKCIVTGQPSRKKAIFSKAY
ncbi:MAG: proline--tRNA ligase [Planctomycetota bacterium]|nr:proline--tRNA ligase [Planctomycetota bacterium]